MALRRRDGIKMHTERRIAGTSQQAMLIRIAQLKRRLGMTQIRGLRIQLGGIALIAENIVAPPSLMHAAELVRSGIVLEIGALGGALEPLEALTIALAEAHFALEAGCAEAGHGAGMVLRRALAVELHGFGGVFARAPAEFVAQSRPIAGFGVAVFAGCDEEREGAVVVFFSFGEEPGGVAIGEVVLGERVGAVRKALEDVAGFAEEGLWVEG